MYELGLLYGALGFFAIIVFIFMFLLFTLLAFSPTLIAIIRKHNNLLVIFLINIFLSWTILGWILALVWSLTDNVERREDGKKKIIRV